MQYREKKLETSHIIWIILTCLLHLLAYVRTLATQLNKDLLKIYPVINMNTILDQIKGEEGKYLYSEYNNNNIYLKSNIQCI